MDYPSPSHMYEAKLEFPEGWGVQTKTFHGRGRDIFSGTTRLEIFFFLFCLCIRILENLS